MHTVAVVPGFAGRFPLSLSLSVALVVASVAPASAAVILVPEDQATIQDALDVAAAGDVIDVAGGVYSEKLVWTSSGNPTMPIVLQSRSGQTAVLDGTGVSGADMILVDTKSFLTISGLEIRNNLGVNDGSGIRILGSGTDIAILDNVIHDIRGDDAMGITVYGTDDPNPIENLTIDGNEIYDCDPARSEALTLNGNVANWTITNNTVRDVNNIAIDCIGGESDIQPNDTLVCRDGVISGNTVERANSIYGGGFAGGIYVDGGRDILIENNSVVESDLGIEVGAENSGLTTENVIVRNNVLAHNERAGLVFGGFASGVGRVENSEFRNNTLYFNNTVGDSGTGTHFNGGGAGELWIQWANDNTVENNLIFAGPENVFVASYDGGSSVNNTIDYNLYFSAGGVASGLFVDNGTEFTGLTAYQSGSGHETNAVAADPLLLDPGAGDYHLASNSPAVDAGNPATVPDVGETDLDGSTRLSGSAIDIGADEATCGDGNLDAGEQCDDSNTTDGDGCDSNCTPTGCGNGVVTGGEDCDDGGTVGGDCCDASCAFEVASSPCDDGEGCTLVDACDGAGVCVGDAAPDPTCDVPTSARRSFVLLRDNGGKDKLKWKWGRGGAATVADFGAPATTDVYRLCVLLESGGSHSVVLSSATTTDEKWTALGSKGFKYRDTNRDPVPDGIQSVLLKAGSVGKAKIKVAGKGGQLGVTGLGFGGGDTVTVELRNTGNGECWAAPFSNFQLNTATQFKAKSD